MTTQLARRVGNAQVIGSREAGVLRFSGIRYAQAPRGALRFAPPVALAPEGEIDARRPGPLAPQLPSALRGVLGEFQGTQSEDCLHLTVWTPDDAGGAERRPVLVWLHGGALQSGGAAIGWYDGAELARRAGCVVVAVNYRLGVLGWLGAAGVEPNLGLRDQQLALQWIRRHVGDFGGDAARLTLMGQSSGALCVAAHIAAGADVARAILQSAPLGRPLRTPQHAQAIGNALLRAAGATDIEAARQVPVEHLLRAQQAPEVRAALQTATAVDGAGLYHLVGDGQTLPPALAIDALAARVDLLIGSTRDEAAAFAGGRTQDVDPTEDAIFGRPARAWAHAAATAGRRAWHYRFDAGPSVRFGACHCIELPFVFGTWDAFHGAPMLEGLDPAHAAPVQDAVQRAWIAFVRDGEAPWACSPHLHLFR